MKLWRRERGIEKQNEVDAVNVTVTRGSVSMGDDAEAPHLRQWTFPSTLSVSAAIEYIVDGGYLPSIAGGRASWIVTTNAGKPLAVVALEGKKRHLLPIGEEGLAVLADADSPTTVRLLFVYEARADPHVLFNRIR